MPVKTQRIKSTGAQVLANRDPMKKTLLDAVIDATFEWAAKRATLPKVRQPDFLKTPMFWYQKQAFGAMLQQKSGILADEMGVGKTLPAIAYMVEMMSYRTDINMAHNRILLVLPAGLICKWKQEIDRAVCPGGLNVVWGHHSVEGGFNIREVPYKMALEADVLVVSYSGLVTEYHDWCRDDEKDEEHVVSGSGLELEELNDLKAQERGKKSRDKSIIYCEGNGV